MKEIIVKWRNRACMIQHVNDYRDLHLLLFLSNCIDIILSFYFLFFVFLNGLEQNIGTKQTTCPKMHPHYEKVQHAHSFNLIYALNTIHLLTWRFNFLVLLLLLIINLQTEIIKQNESIKYVRFCWCFSSRSYSKALGVSINSQQHPKYFTSFI